MAVLTREAILEAKDLHDTTFDVPEWGGEVLIRPMTVAQGEKYYKFTQENKEDNAKVLGMLISISLVDEQGNYLFAEGDVEALLNKSRDTVQKVAEKCLEVNGFADNSLEQAEKN